MRGQFKLDLGTVNRITLYALFIAAVFLIWSTQRFSRSVLPGYPGDAFFPRLVLGILIICLSVLIIRDLLKILRSSRRVDRPISVEKHYFEGNIARLITVIVATIGYGFMLPRVGFELCTFLLLVGLLLIETSASLLAETPKILSIALVFTTIAYAIFVLGLGISLPLLFLPRYL